MDRVSQRPRTRQDPARSGAAGFTLIEVVVTIFVLSMTVMALGPLMTGISRGNNYGQHVTLASGRVQEKIEQLKNRPYANVVNEDETLTSPNMTRTTRVSERVTNALKEVNVTVEWTDRGKPRHVSLRTYLANRTPQ